MQKPTRKVWYKRVYANHLLDYDEEIISANVERIFIGAIYTSKDGL